MKICDYRISLLLPSLVSLALAARPLAAQQPCFSSTGGPNGDFDWVVRDGETVLFDTTLTSIIGGPNGAPTAVETCVGGLVEVRNLLIEPGGEIRVQGPNPMRIQASGSVTIRGLLDLSGFSARDVATVNTGNQAEIGGAGAAGGGRGGMGNPFLTRSTPRGGSGSGPFLEANTGGQGGESGYASAFLGKDARRPGGGGGGRFAADRISVGVPNDFGLAATAGTDGSPQANGAESGQPPPRGGAPGAGAFDDGKSGNDYFGVRPIVGGRGRLLGLLRGELAGLWAGYGGGAGGNAIPSATFPNPSWTFASDEKGGGGGGGGGALHVQALGKIVFGAEGQIRSNGALGGLGENVFLLDHVGGTGGAGSGGHVVLESADAIDFTDGGANANALPHDWVTAYGRPIKTGPLNPCCAQMSNGGASGGGVLQLHVPNPVAPPSADPLADIVVPAAIAAQRHPLDGVSSPEAYALFPTCDPFPRAPLAWFGVAGRDARESFVRLALDAAEASALANDVLPLELPRRF